VGEDIYRLFTKQGSENAPQFSLYTEGYYRAAIAGGHIKADSERRAGAQYYAQTTTLFKKQFKKGVNHDYADASNKRGDDRPGEARAGKFAEKGWLHRVHGIHPFQQNGPGNIGGQNPPAHQPGGGRNCVTPKVPQMFRTAEKGQI
jgi:hypothetical protein